MYVVVNYVLILPMTCYLIESCRLGSAENWRLLHLISESFLPCFVT